MDFATSYFYYFDEWNWLILAALLFALELAAPGVFLIWFGIAAAIVGVLSLAIEMPWQAQLVIFAGLALASVVIGRKFFHSRADQSDRPLLNRRAKRHVGRTYVVAEAIINGRGKVKVGDTVWQVEGPDAQEGAWVTVIDTDGVVLHVEAGPG